ncbi:MAG TPA: hypothetical protein VFI92_07450 [Steroidobacteraceae bacterium]|nr:hypothetical protein [Steroidobacteraceae bacterium]
MARRRRKFDIFSMSFLDTICCAFGALVLLYMILNAAGSRVFQSDTAQLRAEVDKLEEEVLQGYTDLVVLRNSLTQSETDAQRTEGLSDRVLDETERLRQQLAEADKTTVSRREAIERLKADLRQIEEERKRLPAGTPAEGKPGNRVKGFVGTGDRQYLSGLKLGGERIVVLVDVSASMLDETVVNVIRLRNMPESRRLRSDKWRRTVATVDWLTAQIPAKSKFQVIAFNVKAWPIVPNSTGRWLEGSDAQALTDVVTHLRRTVPADGTSLENAFMLMNTLSPAPDNVFIITDGLPTQGASAPLVRKTIDGDGRLKLFERALARYPSRVPANVILMPMEGDPAAPGAFWMLTRRTNGAFLMPAKDWP